MSNIAEIRRSTAEKLGSPANCNRCGTSAAWATLSLYGGMCGHCYAAYCREPYHYHERSKAAERIRAEIAAAGRRVPA
jgi:hypothetical protein